jgi:nitrogen fixation protein NifU and related proteins
MDINNLYQELIIDHGTCPRNFSILPNPTVQEEGFNPLCGDKIILFLEIKENIITQVSFQGHGCAISTASASIMTENLIGKTTNEANKLVENFTNLIINPNNNNNLQSEIPAKLIALISVKNYPSRVKCATLAWHTLEAALKKHRIL